MKRRALAAVAFGAQLIGAVGTGYAVVYVADAVSTAFGLTVERAAALVAFATVGALAFAWINDAIADAVRRRRCRGYRWPA